MSDAVQIALIAATLPALLSIISNVVTHVLSRGQLQKMDKKVDHNIELSNSMLSHTTEKKEEAEKKLEQSKTDELTILRTQLAEANRTIALMTNPPKKE